jgi:hypothetical protein
VELVRSLSNVKSRTLSQDKADNDAVKWHGEVVEKFAVELVSSLSAVKSRTLSQDSETTVGPSTDKADNDAAIWHAQVIDESAVELVRSLSNDKSRYFPMISFDGMIRRCRSMCEFSIKKRKKDKSQNFENQAEKKPKTNRKKAKAVTLESSAGGGGGDLRRRWSIWGQGKRKAKTIGEPRRSTQSPQQP